MELSENFSSESKLKLEQDKEFLSSSSFGKPTKPVSQMLKWTLAADSEEVKQDTSDEELTGESAIVLQ